MQLALSFFRIVVLDCLDIHWTGADIGESIQADAIFH